MPDPAVPTPPATGDTAAAPTAPPVAPDAAAAQTNDPIADATTNLTHAVKVAPALLKAPAAAYDVATAGGDIDSSAQAASLQGSRHVAAQTAAVTAQAHSDHPGGLWGVLDDLGHRVAHDTAQVYEDPAKVLELPLDALNVGMKESQHQFRYLYDVYQRHGLMAALGETMVMLAAGAAGVAVTAGGILGTPFTGGASDVAAGAADAALAGGVEGAEVGLEGTAEGAVEDTAEQAAAKTAQEGSAKTGGKDLQNRLHGPFEFVAPGASSRLRRIARHLHRLLEPHGEPPVQEQGRHVGESRECHGWFAWGSRVASWAMPSRGSPMASTICSPTPNTQPCPTGAMPRKA